MLADSLNLLLIITIVAKLMVAGIREKEMQQQDASLGVHIQCA